MSAEPGSGLGAVPRAIIADDDADIRQLVVIAARKAGVEVVAAVDNGAEAWDAIADGGIDLAILDISMPGMNGIQVTEKVRSDPALTKTRVLVVSASVQMLSGEVDLTATSERKADRFILKPFSPRELTTTITEMMTEE